MQYIVELEKVVKRIVVIEAETDLECGEKLNNGQYLAQYDRVQTGNDYELSDFDYIKHTKCDVF